MKDYTDYMVLPCGGVAYYDEPVHGMNYFCAQCQCVVGSDSMPTRCKIEEAKWDLIKLLGGKGWDYFADTEKKYHDC